MPPMPIVAAPTAMGLTSSGKKLAAVPVVPHSVAAITSATTAPGFTAPLLSVR